MGTLLRLPPKAGGRMSLSIPNIYHGLDISELSDFAADPLSAGGESDHPSGPPPIAYAT